LELDGGDKGEGEGEVIVPFDRDGKDFIVLVYA
jgi:hypothetical protein